MADLLRFTRVDFSRFKAFNKFTLHLRQFNILVGPNNAGKSTILVAFRILSAAMRRATTKKATLVQGPEGMVQGYIVDLSSVSVAEENIFFNYDDKSPASVRFQLSNKNQLLLYFPEPGACYLIAETQGKSSNTPTAFKSQFNCPIGFVPILGPVDHNEKLFEKEAARRALFSYGAARNFRNIWYHYPEKFEEFRAMLNETWPGMDILPPEEVDFSEKTRMLHMFCPEERIPRELFWAGFGFQVWCQMLTHLIQSSDVALFLIDEPDIYLHSDLQRQLLGILRNLGPDILIATHSTEIITEAETDDIVLINKHKKLAKRIKQPSQLGEIFAILGSTLNPVLTQLAKTRRALFVEGKDFQIIAKFARKLDKNSVANRADFAVIPLEGFNPDRARTLKDGIETTLGIKITSGMVLDKDYRSEEERKAITKDCHSFCNFVVIHNRKEIENFLLIPEALDRAASNRVSEFCNRTGSKIKFTEVAAQFLSGFAKKKKAYVTSQFIDCRRRFVKKTSPKINEATITEAAIGEFENCWKKPIEVIPGKDALSAFNEVLQEKFSVNITPTAIINAMREEEIPTEVKDLTKKILQFASTKSGQP